MGKAWPMVGRAEQVRDIVELAQGKRQRGVLITGDMGVGKTRLAGESAAALSRTGWLVARVAGTASGAAVPLGAFARWCADFDVAPAVGVGRVLTALRAEAGERALLLVVDDVNLLDELSALVIHELVLQDIATVIVTMRTGGVLPNAVAAIWKDGWLQRVQLQALPQAEVTGLLGKVLGGPVSSGCAQRMWALTRGNVLFLRHLVEQERAAGHLQQVGAGWEWVSEFNASPSLIELVDLQIGAVPDTVRDVVDLVAVGEPIPHSTLSQLADTAVIGEAETLGLIQVSASTGLVTVGHPLYGEVRLKQCSPSRLRHLRGQIASQMAGALTNSPGYGTIDPFRLGMLWMESDLPPDPNILTAAAAVARSRLDLENAERLAEVAVAANAGSATKLLLAYLYMMREKGRQAEEVLDQIPEGELTTVGLVNPVVLRAANRLWMLQDPKRSRDGIEEALPKADDASKVFLHAFRAVQLALAGWPADTLDAAAAVDFDRLDPFGRTLGRCAQVLALADLGCVKEASSRATAGYAAVSEAPQSSYQGTAVAEFHAFALLAGGHVHEAVEVARDRYRMIADLPGLARVMSGAVLGMAVLAAGDLPAALSHLSTGDVALNGYGEISGLYYRFRISYVEALARAGRAQDAAEMLEEARRTQHPAYQCVESAFLLCSAWVAANAGDLDEAQRLAAEAAGFARTHGQFAREVLCLQAAAQFGEPDVATRLGELAEEVEGPRAATSTRYARALGGHDGSGLDTASTEFEDIGDILAAADAAAQASLAHRAAGRRAESRTASERAVRLARECGGAVSPALSAIQSSVGLTAREREIALKVAQGQSNRQIAAALHLSVRTVEGHIFRAAAKVGVVSRSELGAAVANLPGQRSG